MLPPPTRRPTNTSDLQACALFETPDQDGAEVFSPIGDSHLDADDYLDSFSTPARAPGLSGIFARSTTSIEAESTPTSAKRSCAVIANEVSQLRTIWQPNSSSPGTGRPHLRTTPSCAGSAPDRRARLAVDLRGCLTAIAGALRTALVT